MRETLEPGAVATAVADRHGIGTGLLFTWRKQMLATAMSGFVPVDVVPEVVVPEVPRLEAPPAAAGPTPEVAPGTVEVVLPSGTTVRISGRVDPGMLRAVLAELGGR